MDVKDLKNINELDTTNILLEIVHLHSFQVQMEYSQDHMLGHSRINLNNCKRTEIIQHSLTTMEKIRN